MGDSIGESFVQEFVIGFGLLSGMGIDVNGEYNYAGTRDLDADKIINKI